MEERVWNEKGIEKEGQTAPKESAESRLRAAAHRIMPDESARKRIIDGVKQGKRGRRKLAFRVPAAVLAACLLLSLLCFARPGVIGEEVVVYAATEEHGWQKLEEGERILLKMEPFTVIEEGEDIEAFDENGYPQYYPYICTFRLKVPENCLYDRDFVMLGDDYIGENGGKIEWWVAPERPENAGGVMQGSLSLWLVSDNIVKGRRERIRGYEVELTKEDGKCYAELKRVWEKQGE